MPDLFYVNDYGQFILEDGVVYERIEQLSGSANDTSPDLNGISPFIYNNPDPQGKTNYSIPERMISRYLAANYNEISIPANNTWQTIFTATEGGILRVWIDGEPVSVRVDGGANLTTDFGTGVEADAFPLNVLPGEVVEIQYSSNSGKTGYCTFLPFVYAPS